MVSDAAAVFEVVGELLVHFEGGGFQGVSGDDSGRDSGDGAVGRNGVQYDATSPDFRALANFDVSQNLGTRADQDSLSDFGVTIAGMFSCAAESHFVKDRDVVFNH